MLQCEKARPEMLHHQSKKQAAVMHKLVLQNIVETKENDSDEQRHCACAIMVEIPLGSWSNHTAFTSRSGAAQQLHYITGHEDMCFLWCVCVCVLVDGVKNVEFTGLGS